MRSEWHIQRFNHFAHLSWYRRVWIIPNRLSGPEIIEPLVHRICSGKQHPAIDESAVQMLMHHNERQIRVVVPKRVLEAVRRNIHGKVAKADRERVDRRGYPRLGVLFDHEKGCSSMSKEV